MNKGKKLTFLFTILFGMLFYVGWVFYISEPTYIDHAQVYGLETPAAGEVAKYPLHTYDFVVVPERIQYATDDRNEVETGIVLQVDDKHALVKTIDGRWDDYIDLILDKSHYRVIGRGTIYHKINHYIGFNIMLITQIFITILAIVIGITTFTTLRSVLEDYRLF